MPSTFELANMCNLVYNLEDYGDWKISCTQLRDSGFKAGVYTKDSEQVIAYAGTDNEGDYISDIAMALGFLPNQAYEGQEYFDCVYDSEYFTTITGHSLGGSIASVVGNKYGRDTVTFNSPGVLGLKFLENKNNWYESIERNMAAVGRIFHYIIREDPFGTHRGHLGKVYLAYASPKSEGMKADHTIKQWLKEERYDGNGEYDPSKPININMVNNNYAGLSVTPTELVRALAR